MRKKIKKIKEISSKVKEIKEKDRESGLEEEISDIDKEDFEEFVSSKSVKAAPLEVRREVRELPAAPPAHRGGASQAGEAEPFTYTPRSGEEEKGPSYAPVRRETITPVTSAPVSPVAQREPLFKEPEVVRTNAAPVQEERKYEDTFKLEPEVKGKKYPWERR